MGKRSVPLDQVEDTPVSRARIRLVCAWRDCGRPLTPEEPPLCSAHLKIAHELYIDRFQTATSGYRYAGSVRPEVEPAPVPVPEPRRGVVYYLRSGGYIKIGWTSDLTKRMRAYPPDSLLLAHHPGTRADETTMHRKFAAHRTHGREWYAMVPPLVRHIDQIKATHGAPDEVAFAAQPVTVPQPRPKQYVGGTSTKLARAI